MATSFPEPKSRIAARQAIHQPDLTAFLLGCGQHVLDRLDQHRRQHALGHVAGGTRLQRPDRRLFAAPAGHQNHGNQGILADDLRDQFQPVHFRHDQVGQHEIGGDWAMLLQSLDTVDRELDG